MFAHLNSNMHAGMPGAATVVHLLVAFWGFFKARLPPAARGAISVRDLLACAAFVQDTSVRLGAAQALHHAAHMVLLDGLGVGSGMQPQVCWSLVAGLLPRTDLILCSLCCSCVLRHAHL